MGVNDCGYGIGGIVKAVHELETEGDQQCQRQKHIRPDAGNGHTVEVFSNMNDYVAKAAQHGEQKHHEAHTA